MTWVITLKAPPEPIKVLAAIFKEAPELWYRAKRMHHTYWDLLNSYLLYVVKTYPDKSIDWYIASAIKWLEDKEDVKKAFDFKNLPGLNIDTWSMLLETLNPMTVKVAYNKLLKDGVKFSRYRDTQSFLDKTRENGRQVARKVIGKGAREQRDRMETIAANFDEILPTLKKVLETEESTQGAGSKQQAERKEQLIGAFIDILGEIKLDMEIDWKDLELRVRKYFSGKHKSRDHKKQFVIDLKRKSNPSALNILKRHIPQDAPALQDLFKGVSIPQTQSEYEVVDVVAKIAYEYLIKVNQRKKLHGKNIRELHLPQLKDLVHMTTNKKWINSMLKSVLLDIGESMTDLFRQVYEDKALRKELFLKDYMDEAWEEYDTSTISQEKFTRPEWERNFKQQLQSDKSNQEIEEWKEVLESKRKAIRTIKSGVPPLFVKFMGKLAHALQANAESGNLKELSDAFLEVYSQEEANTFSSEYLKQEQGGFGYQKRVLSPRIGESESENKQYAGRTLPQSPANYVSIVQEVHDMLLGNLDKEGDEDLTDLWDDLTASSEGRVQTKEYHLAGTSDETAKTDFDATLNKFSKPLEKAIAIEIYDAYINGEFLTGSQGIFAASVAAKQSPSDLHLHTWVNFLRFAQNKLTEKKNDIQIKLEAADREIKDSKETGHYNRLREIRTTDPPLFDNEIINLSNALEQSKHDIKDTLIKLVRQKLEDIKDTPEIYINRTYPGVMADLEEMGFIRRIVND